ncbi:3-dehydroquinate synthase OS=Rhodanobacter lindaniclasticus OX=75310 GN=aroB PE=3 SV=1 [Rhodanobacter lindaniclasticus]
MLLAAHLSERCGMSEPGDTARLERLLRTLGLPLTIPPGMDTEQLLQWMRLDKKNAAGQLRLILWRGIGRAEIVDAVAESAVAATLDAAKASAARAAAT